MNEKKSNLIPVIIVCTVVIVAMLGGVMYLLVNNNKNTQNISNNKENEVLKENTSLENNVANNTNTNNQSTINSTTNTVVTGDASNSTKENPLTTGQWGIASKYSVESKKDENVKVKVTKYTRGEEAKKIVKDYIASKSYYKYEEPKENMEWVVVDYDIDYADYTMNPTLGASQDVSTQIKGTGNNNSVKYKDVIYIISTKNIGTDSYTKNKTGTGRMATQIPVGCTDYIVLFGAYNSANAFFKGE